MLFYSTGDCVSKDLSYNASYCRPECFKGIAKKEMCGDPLGVGRVLCNYEGRGTLMSVTGNLTLLKRAKTTKVSVKGQTSGATAQLLLAQDMVMVNGSENFFIDKEPLTLSTGTPGFRAGVTTLFYQPIDDLSVVNLADVKLVNVSEVAERFGEDALERYEEQFIPSPLLYQVIVAIESVALAAVAMLHVILVYKEQERIRKLKNE